MTELPPPWDSMPPTLLASSVLRQRGLTRRRIAREVASGLLTRVRKGSYLPHGAHPDLLLAGRLGGRLDCVSLLRHLGVFVLARPSLHVQIEVGMSRLPTRPDDVRCHWRASGLPREYLVTDVVSALVQACRCQDPRAAIATLDSAWHLDLIDEDGVAEVFARLPRRYSRLRPLLDRLSESGTESLIRLILRSLGCAYEVQARIDGVGRVDFVVDGWLTIECDSESHHSGWQSQKRDRRRDLAAAQLGYTTIRPIAEDILYHRDQVRAALTRILAAHHNGVQNSSRRQTQTARMAV